MGCETEELLPAEHHPHHLEEGQHEGESHNSHPHECAKKHGLFCRILTTLHLKKKTTEHQKLLSESQEHLPHIEDSHKKQTKKSKKKEKKGKGVKTSKSSKESTTVPINIPRGTPSLSANKNNNNHTFATTYEILDNESHHSFEFFHGAHLENVPNVDQVKEPTCVEHVTLRNVHMYGDQQFGECYMSRIEENPLIDKSNSQNTGQYLRHQWQGKRAKKARKRIRRVMRATYLSLQSTTNNANIIPSPHTIATAAGRRR